MNSPGGERCGTVRVRRIDHEPVWSTRTMVDFRAPLNDGQLEVLRWIAQGCPDGVMKGHSHKRIAIALQDRRLVKISKKGGIWRAETTDAGHHYLEHGDYPDDYWAIRQSRAFPPPTQRPKRVRPETTV